ncbi:DUF3641 domain-containing protein [Sulfuriflexus sp.]|uniref:DUF3641 domain-containing protein n=1 Tax=Sulfuriflexus sp. TaxID=2015443 RepID=UPI0028CCA745|nr:DUF3641 domain-containing protein [Sulfuriflexus sp.]MDT8405451.1 DUF3641 domain-containing protein [Sulfuriflexus sp.]
MLSIFPILKLIEFLAICRGSLTSLQVSPGYHCNQQCLYCHVNAAAAPREERWLAGHCYGCTAGQGSSCGGALSE